MLTVLRVLHVLSASVWVGGTVVLVFVGVPAIRTLEGDARATAMRALGRRWRPLGWSAMAVAILSGLWLTELNGGFAREALDTDFDRTLILKSVLVALLVVGALLHDYVLGPRLQRELRVADPAAPCDEAPTRRRRMVQLRAHPGGAHPGRGRPHDARLMTGRSRRQSRDAARAHVPDAARHLALLTRTTEVVNSSLDLQEVLEAIAHEVAAALGTDACFVYLYDEPTDELVLRATHGTGIEDATSAPRMRSGEGITGAAAAEREPIMIAERAHLDPRFKAFPNLREDQYESILAVPILARDVLEGALNVRTRAPRAFTDAEIGLLTSIASQVGQSIDHAKLYAQARRRVGELEALARISEAVSESLYLEESLEAIVKTTVESLRATGAAVVLEDGRVAWPEGRAGAHAVRLPLRWRGRQIGELVVDRDTPFSDDDRQLLDAIASQAAVALEHGRMALRGVLAQEIHHRVKNNLQTVASLLRLQARAEGVDPQKALGDSVNRILAIAAVHEELTEHREDVVDLAELVDRLRAILVQGLVAGKTVSAQLEPVELAGQRATALALVFSELLSNALEHGGQRVSIELAAEGAEVVLVVSDDGEGLGDAGDGTGMSIVRALVRDELGGTLRLVDGDGLRAEVRFAA